MATSRFFKHNTSSNEQRLLDDLNKECIHQRGEDLSYIPRLMVNEDSLLGEDPSSIFLEAVTIEMIIEDVESYGGEGDYMSRYGLDIRDEITFLISKTRFIEEVTEVYDDVTRPREGDLISFETGKAIFEIVFVEHEQPFYQLGRNPIYKCMCKRFQYSHEDLVTGIEKVDEISLHNVDADYDIIADEIEEVVDFTETNPFGE